MTKIDQELMHAVSDAADNVYEKAGLMARDRHGDPCHSEARAVRRFYRAETVWAYEQLYCGGDHDSRLLTPDEATALIESLDDWPEGRKFGIAFDGDRDHGLKGWQHHSDHGGDSPLAGRYGGWFNALRDEACLHFRPDRLYREIILHEIAHVETIAHDAQIITPISPDWAKNPDLPDGPWGWKSTLWPEGRLCRLRFQPHGPSFASVFAYLAATVYGRETGMAFFDYMLMDPGELRERAASVRPRLEAMRELL